MAALSVARGVVALSIDTGGVAALSVTLGMLAPGLFPFNVGAFVHPTTIAAVAIKQHQYHMLSSS